jgi:hypothetical protein
LSTDDDTDDGKKSIPLQLIPFVGIVTATPEQLLYVEENGNGIQSSLVPQSPMDGMGRKKGDREHWKAHHHHGCDDELSEILDYIVSFITPFLRSAVAAGYDNICSHCSKFYGYFQAAGMALNHKWNAAGKRMDEAAAEARKSPDAGNFLELQRAHLQKMTVGTEIIMHGAAKTGKTADYHAAKTDRDQLIQFDQKLKDLQDRLADKTESEKEAILQQAFPGLWDQYKLGNLTQAEMGGTVRPSQDLGGIAQPFIQTLKDLFAAAGQVLCPNSNGDWSEQAGQKNQPQPAY